jgi:hypothetical protein
VVETAAYALFCGGAIIAAVGILAAVRLVAAFDVHRRQTRAA